MNIVKDHDQWYHECNEGFARGHGIKALKDRACKAKPVGHQTSCQFW